MGPAVAGTTTPNKRGSFSECATYNEKYHVEVDEEWVKKQLRDVAANTTTSDNTQEEGSKSQPAEDEWTEEQLEAMKPKGSARQARKGSLTCTYSGQYGKNEQEQPEEEEEDGWTEEQLEALASGQCTTNDFEQQQDEGWTEEQLEAMKPKGFRQTEKNSQ